jgi:hypothetical protein
MSFLLYLFAASPLLFLIWLGVVIGLCWHAVKTHQDTFWIWIIVIAPGLGALAYAVIVLIPSLTGGSAARKLRSSAREALDPHREYREAKAACEDSPTVANRMRLASAAAGQGRHAEAEALYREAASGVHADDPALLLGRAKALIELKQFDEALLVLGKLEALGENSHSPAALLALARTRQGLGQTEAADTAYRAAVQKMPGFEAISRYTAFLAEAGRMAEAKDQLSEIDQRLARAAGPFRKEAQAWRDLAAAKVR